MGKFPCSVCNKRFTRSDLLNRHRRIHGAQADAASHVTDPASSSSSPGQPPQPKIEDRQSASQDVTGFRADLPMAANHTSQVHPQYEQNFVKQEAYQHPLTAIPNFDTLQHQATSQGLTSLMEAALAPQETAFQPVDKIDPSLWDGFMRFGDNPSTYMGAYDADMSWTLDYLPSEHSPNYLLDQDMLNAFDDFGSNPYQYQALQYAPPPAPEPPEEVEGDDEDTHDWPDKVDKPPERFAPRALPIQLRQISWQSAVDEGRASGLTAATIRPMHPVTRQLRDSLLTTLNGANFRNESSRPEISDAIFPPAEALDYFLRLYVRYIQPRYPVLHLPTFDIYTAPPLLLVAMMFLGSSHSTIDRGRFSRLFHEHLRIACIRMQEVDKKWVSHSVYEVFSLTKQLRTINNVLTYFLLCLAGTWSGSKHSYEFAEGARGILITACRRNRLLDCRPVARVDIETYQKPGRSHLEAIWLAWAETEKRKRLGLSIYVSGIDSRQTLTNMVDLRLPIPSSFQQSAIRQ